MKRDRLYGITIYLLNHGRTSAKTLAEYFEVSVRDYTRIFIGRSHFLHVILQFFD